jgi:carbon storage regulator
VSNLVLSRKAGEKIMIGAHIEVMVAEIRGDKVRLSVRAPRELRVDREEVRRSIEARGFRRTEELLEARDLALVARETGYLPQVTGALLRSQTEAASDEGNNHDA